MALLFPSQTSRVCQFVKKECEESDEKDGEEEDGESRKEWEGDEVVETMGRIERRKE